LERRSRRIWSWTRCRPGTLLTLFIAADGASSGFDRALSADDDLR
jgi:hypothetical protein